jgi:hypothetical protein
MDGLVRSRVCSIDSKWCWDQEHAPSAASSFNRRADTSGARVAADRLLTSVVDAAPRSSGSQLPAMRVRRLPELRTATGAAASSSTRPATSCNDSPATHALGRRARTSSSTSSSWRRRSRGTWSMVKACITEMACVTTIGSRTLNCGLDRSRPASVSKMRWSGRRRSLLGMARRRTAPTTLTRSTERSWGVGGSHSPWSGSALRELRKSCTRIRRTLETLQAASIGSSTDRRRPVPMAHPWGRCRWGKAGCDVQSGVSVSQRPGDFAGDDFRHRPVRRDDGPV